MTINVAQIVLASSSSYRKKQLSQLGLTFRDQAPNCDESPLIGESAQHLAQRLSREKAHSLAHNYPQHIIIGSDQTAECSGEILGKALSEEKAIEQLQLCNGKLVTFFSGIAVLNSNSGKLLEETVATHVHFRQLTHAQIEYYVRFDNPIYCAGSFKCESLGIALFSKIESEDPSALIGLPLIKLSEMLTAVGVDVLQPAELKNQ